MSGEAVKRLDRLAPNLVYVCGFVWEWTYLNAIRPSITEGVLGGHTLKSLLKLSNGWTDWHQIWHTCADSSGNGYTPNKLPFETQAALGGFRGSNIQNSGEAVKRLDRYWHKLWFTSADSSGNGHRLNTTSHNTPGGIWMDLWGHKFKCLGKLSNGSTDWHQIWYMSADSSGNGHT